TRRPPPSARPGQPRPGRYPSPCRQTTHASGYDADPRNMSPLFTDLGPVVTRLVPPCGAQIRDKWGRRARSARWAGRAVLPGQLGDYGVVGGVDGLAQLVVGDRAAGPQRVPARAPDVGHDRGVAGVAQDPLVGHLTVRAALEAHRGGRSRAQEG